jgi:uncharacterized membrane protein YbhN (UPF0104 family)
MNVIQPKMNHSHDAQPGAAPRRPLRDTLVLLLKLGGSAGLLWLVLRSMDPRAVAASLRTASVPLLALALASAMANVPLGAVRWWLVLKGIGRAEAPLPRGSLGPIISLYWLGFLFSQVLPASAGDGMRVWLTVRRGYRLQAALNSVVLERVTMLLGLFLIVAATQPLLTRRIGATGWDWLPALGLLGGLGGVGLLLLPERITARLTGRRLFRLLAPLSADTRRLAGSSWAVPLLVMTLLVHLNLIVFGALIGMALDLRLSFADYVLFIPLVVLATILPISISGWGVREGLLVVLLGRVGIADHDALAMSVLVGAFSMASSLPGLAIWWRTGMRRGG